MSLFNNTKMYFCKYVDTATKGVVAVDWAVIADRVKLSCTKCGLELTCLKPKDDNDPIDYGVQAFVNLHAHRPPPPEPPQSEPETKPIQTTVFPPMGASGMENFAGKQVYSPAAQANFKGLPVSGSMQQAATFDYKTGQMTDKSFGKQAIIADKLKEYQAEVNAKTDDMVALKIAQLQAEGAEKAVEAQKAWLIADDNAEIQKLENIAMQNKAKAAALKIKFEQELADAKAELAMKKELIKAQMESNGEFETEEGTIPKPKGKWVFVGDADTVKTPKKSPGALEEPEGRKFR